MLAKLKALIAPILVSIALLIIGYVGHRHWFVETRTPVEVTTTLTEPVVDPEPTREPTVTEPVVVKKTKKPPVKKTTKKPQPLQEPRRGPRRECTPEGYCWIYIFPWEW